jgi:hypothetical protein
MMKNEELEKMGILFFIGWCLVVIGMVPIWKCIEYYTWGYHYATRDISVFEIARYVLIGVSLVITGFSLMRVEYVRVKKMEVVMNEIARKRSKI